ncbi:MAG: hypothetical protein QOE58_546 [Actinomycetota bacterium]|jgi:hypothetical protein|nr:hypothetical protein [Actinomycetota bacterium]
MKISAVIDYSATAQEVFAMLADEDFQTRKCAATGSLRHTVSITKQDDRTKIVNTRDMATDDFPSFVRNMVGSSLSLTETQDWGPPEADGARQGRITVDIAGAPIELSGKLSLAAGGQGTVETIEADLKAGIPILGNKMEQAAAPAVKSAIRVESETGKSWLAAKK